MSDFPMWLLPAWLLVAPVILVALSANRGGRSAMTDSNAHREPLTPRNQRAYS